MSTTTPATLTTTTLLVPLPDDVKKNVVRLELEEEGVKVDLAARQLERVWDGTTLVVRHKDPTRRIDLRPSVKGRVLVKANEWWDLDVTTGNGAAPIPGAPSPSGPAAATISQYGTAPSALSQLQLVLNQPIADIQELDLLQFVGGQFVSILDPAQAATTIDPKTVRLATRYRLDDRPVIAAVKDRHGVTQRTEAQLTSDACDGEPATFQVSRSLLTSEVPAVDCDDVTIERGDCSLFITLPVDVSSADVVEVTIPGVSDRTGEQVRLLDDNRIEYFAPSSQRFPESEFPISVTFPCGDDPHHDVTVVVGAHVPEAEPVGCTTVAAARTRCGVRVELPEAFSTTEGIVVERPGELDGKAVRKVGPRAVEYVPGPGDALPDTAFWLNVEYSCGGCPRQTHVDVDPVPADEPSSDGCRDVFRLPLRVETVGAGSGAGGTVSSGELVARTGKILDQFVPGASRPTATAQLRAGLAKLLAPSPNGIGIHAATLAIAGAGASMTPLPWAGGPPGGGGGGGGGGSHGGWGGGTAVLAAPRPQTAAAAGWPSYTSSAAWTGAMVSASVSGPFASFRTAADVLEAYGLTALRELQPLTQTADLDKVEAERAIVEDAVLGLIEEFRRDDGPERAAADVLVRRLGLHLNELGTELGVLPAGAAQANASSNADYENIGRFDALQRWLNDATNLLQSWTPGSDPRSGLIDLNELLAVVVESDAELESELTAALVDEQERKTIILPSQVQGVGDISLARLLEWIRVEAGERLPALIARAGARAGGSVAAMLSDQQAFVDYLLGLGQFPWTHQPIQRALTDLSTQLGAAATLATNVKPAGVP